MTIQEAKEAYATANEYLSWSHYVTMVTESCEKKETVAGFIERAMDAVLTMMVTPAQVYIVAIENEEYGDHDIMAVKASPESAAEEANNLRKKRTDGDVKILTWEVQP